MAKSNNSAAPKAAALQAQTLAQSTARKAEAAKVAETAKTLVGVLGQGEAAVSAAEAQLLGAKASQAQQLAKVLAGHAKVTGSTFDNVWKEAVKKALADCGRYAEASLAPKVNLLKVFVVAITHDVTPKEGETLHNFRARALEEIKARGVYVAANEGGRKPNPLAAAKARNDAKGKSGKGKAYAAADVGAMCLHLAGGDSAAAAVIEEFFGDPSNLAPFVKWANKMLAA